MNTPQRVEAYLAQSTRAEAERPATPARPDAGGLPCVPAVVQRRHRRGPARSWPTPTSATASYTISHADGSSREFYRIGLSANATGISVYVLGLDDKTYLARTYGASIGKASVTGYCIRFRRLSAIDNDVLRAAIHDGMSVDRARAECRPSRRLQHSTPPSSTCGWSLARATASPCRSRVLFTAAFWTVPSMLLTVPV